MVLMSLTFAALVEALGTTGEVDKAIEMVEEMERRGVLECAGVYYALASALCAVGRLSEALVQV
jgi:pentatricopeptide repeat protein